MKWLGLTLLLSFSTLLGCQKPKPSSSESIAHPTASAPKASSSTAASSSANRPPGGSDFPEEEAEDAPVTLGPEPASAPPAERDLRLRQLLEGRAGADRFPLVHTDPSTDYDPRLFRNLTTVMVGPRLRGLGDLLKILPKTGPLKKKLHGVSIARSPVR